MPFVLLLYSRSGEAIAFADAKCFVCKFTAGSTITSPVLKWAGTATGTKVSDFGGSRTTSTVCSSVSFRSVMFIPTTSWCDECNKTKANVELCGDNMLCRPCERAKCSRIGQAAGWHLSLTASPYIFSPSSDNDDLLTDPSMGSGQNFFFQSCLTIISKFGPF